MAHSPLYGTSVAGGPGNVSFGELEPIIDAFLDRFGGLSVVAIDLGGEQNGEAAGPLRGGYNGLCTFLARADVVGRLRGGTLAAIMIGFTAEAARWEAEKVWRQDGSLVSGPHRIALGIAQFEYGDTVDALVARAERALAYGRRHGADKAVELTRTGHMLVSDFLGRADEPGSSADSLSATDGTGVAGRDSCRPARARRKPAPDLPEQAYSSAMAPESGPGGRRDPG